MITLLLSCGERKEITEKPVTPRDFTEYFNVIKSESLQTRFKDISFFELSRDSVKLYKLFLPEREEVTLKLNKDYSYEILSYQDSTKVHNEIPDYAVTKLNEVVEVCKKLQITGFTDQNNSFTIYVKAESINDSTLPASLVGSKGIKKYYKLINSYNPNETPSFYKANELTNLDEHWHLYIEKEKCSLTDVVENVKTDILFNTFAYSYGNKRKFDSLKFNQDYSEVSLVLYSGGGIQNLIHSNYIYQIDTIYCKWKLKEESHMIID